MNLRELLPRTPRGHRILRGPLRGKKIWTSWYDYPRAVLGVAELSLCEWILRSAQPGETWIDVGAHHGVTALAMCEAVGHSGRVIAFEPVLASAGLLARTRESNRLWQLCIVPLALGDTDSVRLLHVSGQCKGMVGIIPKMRDGKWTPTGEVIYEGSFDNVWPKLNGSNDTVHGVKIDAQGAEAYVLRGMSRTLTARRPRLVVEYHEYADADDLLSAIDGIGYSRDPKAVNEPAHRSGSRLHHGISYEFVPRSGAA